jgi:hypothetical protein
MHTEKDIVLLGVYVDDILVGEKDVEAVIHIKESLKNEFEIEEIGELREVFGMKVSQTPEGIFLSQTKHIRQLLQQMRKEINEFDIPMINGFHRVKPDEKKCSSNIK